MEVEFHEALLAVLSLAFLCWAGVIAWIGTGIRNDLKEESKKLNTYMLYTEKRLSIIETTLGINAGNHSFTKLVEEMEG